MPDPTPQVTVRNIPQDSYNSNAASGGMGAAPIAGGGIKGHFQRNWPIYTIGLGALTILVIIYMNGRNNSVNNNLGSTSGTMGNAPDQLWGSQLDADLQQLMTVQNQQIGLLQQMANGTTNPSNNPPAPNPPINIPDRNFINHWRSTLLPSPKNTAGMSNNFWVYFTKQGDTAASINSNVAHWDPNNPSKFMSYRNNADILHGIGYDTSNPFAPLPAGIAVSV